jgi:hypothetical protein
MKGSVDNVQYPASPLYIIKTRSFLVAQQGIGTLGRNETDKHFEIYTQQERHNYAQV